MTSHVGLAGEPALQPEGFREAEHLCYFSLLYNSVQLGLEFSQRASNLSSVLGKKMTSTVTFACK